MLSAPAPYPTVSAQNPAPDDAQIEGRPPEICVDYLSHNWKDEDVWNSWKAMTKHKNEISNGLRLENASWRTWAKQRGNLKTVSPETLNWLKESDVTWLYGPLHGEAKAVPPPKVATTAERLGIDVSSTGKKSILKHRSLSDILQTPLNVSPPNESELSTPLDRCTITESDKPMQRAHSRNTTLNLGPLKPSAPRVEPTKKERHISFNTLVSQCIALDDDSVGISYYDNEYSDADDEDETDVESRRRIEPCVSSPKRSGRHVTIAMMPPTHLKMGHEFMPESEDEFTDDVGAYNERSINELDARYSVSDPVLGDDGGYDYYYDDDDADDYPMSHALSLGAAQQDTAAASTAVATLPSDTHLPSKIPTTFGCSDPHAQPLDDDKHAERALNAGDDGDDDDALRPPPIQVGPTPYNSPISMSPHANLGEESQARMKSVLKSQGSQNKGAIVAPSAYFPPVPLSHDYVEEHEGGLIASAVEIINTARDLFGVITGSSWHAGRSWYDSQ